MYSTAVVSTQHADASCMHQLIRTELYYICVHSCSIRPYCIFGNGKITNVGTFSFRWILPFWYFCFLLDDKASLALSSKRKQKYQNGNIHRKLKVPTSEREGKLSNPRARAARAPCREKIYENLWKPARGRRAHVFLWFCRNQKYSTMVCTR
jgi:hypothetical protein